MAKKKKRKPRAQSIEKFTRWAPWEQQVLSKVNDPGGCQKLIKNRQKAVDADKSEAELVVDHFRRELKRRNHVPKTCCVFIPSRVAAEWLYAATLDRRVTNKATEHLKGLGIVQLKKTKKDGSPGWRWKDPNANGNKGTPERMSLLNRLPDRERNRSD